MTTTLVRFAGTLAVAAFLAGCAGAGTAPPTGANAAIVSQQSMAGGLLAEPAKCKESAGIKVKPCSVSLSATNATADVSVKYPKGDDISDSDKVCSNKDIATVTGTAGKYVVAAGTKTGACNVTFTVTDGKKTVGTGTLKIVNNV